MFTRLFREDSFNCQKNQTILRIQLSKTGTVRIEADKNTDGSYVPGTARLSVKEPGIKKRLTAYKALTDQKEEFEKNPAGHTKKEQKQRLDEIEKNIEDGYLKIASDSSLHRKAVNYNDILSDTKHPNLRKLEGIVVECSDMEIDFILQSAKFIKKYSKEIGGNK